MKLPKCRDYTSPSFRLIGGKTLRMRRGSNMSLSPRLRLSMNGHPINTKLLCPSTALTIMLKSHPSQESSALGDCAMHLQRASSFLAHKLETWTILSYQLRTPGPRKTSRLRFLHKPDSLCWQKDTVFSPCTSWLFSSCSNR